jgi:sec-independent protein translocase protein TatB
MFDLSFSELLLVAAVGLLVIGPKDLPKVILTVKKSIAKIKNIARDFTSSLTDIDEISDLKEEVRKINNEMRTIIDLNGNEQETYDLSDVMPQINDNKAKKDESSESDLKI